MPGRIHHPARRMRGEPGARHPAAADGKVVRRVRGPQEVRARVVIRLKPERFGLILEEGGNALKRTLNLVMMALASVGIVVVLPWLLLGQPFKNATPVATNVEAGAAGSPSPSATAAPTLAPSPRPTPTARPVATRAPQPLAPTRTTVPTVLQQPQGNSMPTGDITDSNGKWHQIFAENFNTSVPVGSFPGSVYGPKWKVYLDGWKDSTGNGTYYPSKVLSVTNGYLNMHLHTEITNGVAVHMVAAPEPRLPTGYGQVYGRYSVRFYVDPVPGYKTAWLLWPDSGIWPAGGEIDYPDCNLTQTIHAFMHWASPSGGQTAFSTTVPEAGAWHIATEEWQPGKVTFILDGSVIGVATTLVPSDSMHYVLQTETQLSGGAPSNSAAGNVKVDWVTVYSYA